MLNIIWHVKLWLIWKKFTTISWLLTCNNFQIVGMYMYTFFCKILTDMPLRYIRGIHINKFFTTHSVTNSNLRKNHFVSRDKMGIPATNSTWPCKRGAFRNYDQANKQMSSVYFLWKDLISLGLETSLQKKEGKIFWLTYRLFFLRSIAQFFTQIYMNCLSVHKLNKLGKFW